MGLHHWAQAHLLFDCRLIASGQCPERAGRFVEMYLDLAHWAVAEVADNDLCQATFGIARAVVVDLIAIDEENHLRILLDGSGFPEVRRCEVGRSILLEQHDEAVRSLGEIFPPRKESLMATLERTS